MSGLYLRSLSSRQAALGGPIERPTLFVVFVPFVVKTRKLRASPCPRAFYEPFRRQVPFVEADVTEADLHEQQVRVGDVSVAFPRIVRLMPE